MGKMSGSSADGPTMCSLASTRPGAFFFLLLGGIFILSYTLHRMETKVNISGDPRMQLATLQWTESKNSLLFPESNNSLLFPESRIWPKKDDIPTPRGRVEGGQRDEEVKYILAKLDKLMPHRTFTDINTSTSAKNSRATLVNHKDAYCVGEQLAVQLDVYDRAGRRKEYGGDFLRARISSSHLQAGASGLITDYRNGTYLVNFTLFWEGTIKVSLLLMHPSEGVSALWAARKKGYDKIAFTGKFLNGTSEVLTECGFAMNTTAELCKYVDERDQEAFYCMKPSKVPCEAFIWLSSQNTPISYVTPLEQSLLQRTNVAVAIPKAFGEIHVIWCENKAVTVREKCKLGMDTSSTSGFVWKNLWHPAYCYVPRINTMVQINTCLKGKLIYLMGDSTLRQWLEYLTQTLRGLRYINMHGFGKHQNLYVVNIAKNIQIHWKKHGHPLVTVIEYMTMDHNYIAREIDSIAGDKDTAIVVCLGQHFRPFPIELFIRRMINIREAVQRLFLRSPETKFIIKSENIREIDVDLERFGDFHGYTQMLAVKDIFRGLNVGFIDAWDMTIAYDTSDVHPPYHVVENQINLFLSYIC